MEQNTEMKHHHWCHDKYGLPTKRKHKHNVILVVKPIKLVDAEN